MAYVYIVRCVDDTLYTGITTDLEKRMKAHSDPANPNGAKYTKSHRIKEVVAAWTTEKYSDAARLEYAIKRLKRRDKLTLIQTPSLVGDMFEKLSEIEFEPMERAEFENLIENEK